MINVKEYILFKFDIFILLIINDDILSYAFHCINFMSMLVLN
jgi:hypothetical protein